MIVPSKQDPDDVRDLPDDVWDLSESVAEDEETWKDVQRLGASSPADSEHNRQLQRENDNHKRTMETERAAFDRDMEKFKIRHDRWTNYAILAIVSLLFFISVGVLSSVAYQVKNDNTLRDKAISLLAPLTGLALGFLSGKIKWPAL